MFISFSSEIIPSPTSPLADDPNSMKPLGISYFGFIALLARFWDVFGYLTVKSDDTSSGLKV